MPVDQIAQEDGVSVKAVEKSIMRMERHRARLTLQEIHAAEMVGLLQSVHAEAVALSEALRATHKRQMLDEKNRPVVDDDGAPLYVELPDHDTRLDAIDRRTAILNALAPKGGGIKIQNNNMSGGDGTTGSTVKYVGVEDRIIGINQKRALMLAAAPGEGEGAVIECDVVDAGDDE
jgi:hypothetical protein